MARPPKRRSSIHRKAKRLTGEAQAPELLQAIHIWKVVLELDRNKFKDDPLKTEEYISMQTWEDCTREDFRQRPHIYKAWNDKVIERWHSLDDKCRITRINDTMPIGPQRGQRVTKICRSDHQHAISRLKHKTNIAAGVAFSALQENERFGLKQNIGKMIAEKTYKNIDERMIGVSKERKLKIAAQSALSQAVEMGEKMGRKNIVNELLGHFDAKPALIEADNKNGDDYSEGAKRRRKGKEGKK